MVNEHNNKKRGHNKFNARGIKLNDIAKQRTKRRAGHPIDLIKQGYKKHKPTFINIGRRRYGAVDRKRFIAHSVNQIGLLPIYIFVLIQHGNTVKQVAGIYH